MRASGTKKTNEAIQKSDLNDLEDSTAEVKMREILTRIEEAESHLHKAIPASKEERAERVRKAEAQALEILQKQEDPIQRRFMKMGDARIVISNYPDGMITAGTGLWVGDNVHVADQLMTMATQNLGMVLDAVKRSDQLSNARGKASETKKRPDPLKALISALVDQYFEDLDGRILRPEWQAAWRFIVAGLIEGDRMDEGAEDALGVIMIEGIPDHAGSMTFTALKGIDVTKVIEDSNGLSTSASVRLETIYKYARTAFSKKKYQIIF
jgi:hypothetical protein